MIKNFLTSKFKVTGKNNQIISIKGNVRKNVFFGKSTSFLEIKGNNNTVIFNYDECKKIRTKLPKNVKIIVRGDNNVVKINFPIKFQTSKIYQEGNDNFFEIGTTSKVVRGATFLMCNKSSVIIGKNCQLRGGELRIIASDSCNEISKIQIGDNCYFARDVLIRNSHGHILIDAATGLPIKDQEPKDIIIGDNVWITSKCALVRGASIAKGSIVGACSLVNKSFDEENVVITGVPAKIIKHNITWDAKHLREYAKMQDMI